METTAEIRWFWRNEAAALLGRRFIDGDIHGCDAAGGDVRTDVYLNENALDEALTVSRGRSWKSVRIPAVC